MVVGLGVTALVVDVTAVVVVVVSDDPESSLPQPVMRNVEATATMPAASALRMKDELPEHS